jgi:hypothetical protein
VSPGCAALKAAWTVLYCPGTTSVAAEALSESSGAQNNPVKHTNPKNLLNDTLILFVISPLLPCQDLLSPLLERNLQLYTMTVPAPVGRRIKLHPHVCTQLSCQLRQVNLNGNMKNSSFLIFFDPAIIDSAFLR